MKIIKKISVLIAFLAMFQMCSIAQQPLAPTEKIEAASENPFEVIDEANSKALAFADTTVQIVPIDEFPLNEGVPAVFSFFLSNWSKLLNLLVLLTIVIEAIVSIYPTEKNRSLFQKIREFLDGLNFFQNNKIGGGKFIAKSEVKK